MMKKNNKPNIWSTEEGFGIIDILSLSFSLVYFCIIIAAIVKPNDSLSTIQSNMNALMMVILGGYFGDQIVNKAVTKLTGGTDIVISRQDDIGLNDMPATEEDYDDELNYYSENE